jgi:hypothetical protein
VGPARWCRTQRSEPTTDDTNRHPLSNRLQESGAYNWPCINDDGDDMCTGAQRDCGCIDLLDDPLIRLVMKSDGVSEDESAALIRRVRLALLSRGEWNYMAAAERWADRAGEDETVTALWQRPVGWPRICHKPV